MTDIISAPKFSLKNIDPKGIPFQGLKDAEIPGRKSVKKNIDDFIKRTKNSRSIEVSLLKAEWGEGKTDAYERYIHPKLKNDFCYLVSTSTLSNRIRKFKKEFPQGNTAVTFLSSLFASLSDDLKAKNDVDYEIFYQDEIKNPVDYLDNCLEKMFKSNNKQCYIFLDELEEILINTDVKFDIISGLKEMINKNYATICEDGKFEGRLHMFIACTPHAWNTITEDPEFYHAMGSTKQRLVSSLIELPLLSKDDCYYFLRDLTKLAYNGAQQRLPIASSGIFETIINSSQRNPRSLIQLFYTLMSNVEKVGSNKIKCIDYDDIRNNLKDKKIDVYGSEVPAIEFEVLETLQNSLGVKNNAEDLLKIFNLIIGEHFPFSIQEISDRLKISLRDLPNLINEINLELQNSNKIDSSIQDYYPIKEGNTLDSILSDLTTVGQGDQLRIVFDDLTVNVNVKNLESVLTHSYLDVTQPQEGLKHLILLPASLSEFIKILNIDSQNLNELYYSLKKNFEQTSSSKRFLLSQTLLENTFPSPNLVKFDFIHDRNKRLDFRRAVQRDLGDLTKRDYLHASLRKGLIDLLQFTSFQCKDAANYLLLEMKLDTKTIEIPLLIESFIENITDEKITKIIDLVDSTPAVLTLLFYHSLSDETIHDKLDKIGEIQKIPLDRISIEQLLVWQAAKKSGIKINDISARQRFTELSNLIRIEYYLKESWIPKALDSGIIITDFQGLGEHSIEQKKAVITSFINSSNLSLDDSWKFYQKLVGLKLFSEKSTFVPADITSQDNWTHWAVGLSKNHFLTPPSGSILQLTDTPVETRILDKIGKNRNSIVDLEKEFVILSDASNKKEVLKKYYLDTLIQKGKIIEKSNQYELLTSIDTEIISQLKDIQKFLNDFTTLKSQDRFVSQIKQKESKVISESDYIKVLQEILNKIKSAKSDEKQRLSKLVLVVYHYYVDKFRNAANLGDKNIKEIFDSITHQFDEFQSNIDSIINSYNGFCKNTSQYLSKEKFLEQLKEDYNKIYTLFDTVLQKNFVITETEKIWKKQKDPKKSPFGSERDAEDANFFSLKYYLLSNLIKQFKQDLEKKNLITQRIIDETEKLNSATLEINSHTKTKVFNEKLQISNKILRATQEIKPPSPPTTSIINNFEDLERFFSRISEQINSFKEHIQSTLKYLDDLAKNEENVVILIDEDLKLVEKIDNFFEGAKKISSNKIENWRSEVSKIKDEYENITSSIQSSISTEHEFVKQTSELNIKISQLSSKLKDIHGEINQVITSYTDRLETEKESTKKFIQICIKDFSEEKKNEFLNKEYEYETMIVDRLKEIYKLKTDKKWTDFYKELKQTKRDLITKMTKELGFDEDTTYFLSLVADLSEGEEFIDPKKLQEKLDEINMPLFHPTITNAVQTLFKTGYIKLGIKLNTDVNDVK